MLNYYICGNCHFQFERIGICEQCPDCGKERVREATDTEKEKYLNMNKAIFQTGRNGRMTSNVTSKSAVTITIFGRQVRNARAI